MADEITSQSPQVLPPPEESAPPKRRRRRWLWVLGALGILFVLWLFFIFSVELLHYTESAAFCSSCHVMHPENTAYENSPHARAECGTCHIGPGALAAFQAKMANVRYLWVYPTGNYERPIPSPITSLRPVEVVCEQCHWPEKFYADRMVSLPPCDGRAKQPDQHCAADEDRRRHGRSRPWPRHPLAYRQSRLLHRYR